MNSLVLKLVIITCLIFQYGCGIKFKRKSVQTEDKPVEMQQYDRSLVKTPVVATNDKMAPTDKFSESDAALITAYYADEANRVIRDDMIVHTRLTDKQEEKLGVTAFIPSDVQVMPLPLKLERKLSALPLDLIRVHVGTRVIIMNVKSRQILDIIKI